MQDVALTYLTAYPDLLLREGLDLPLTKQQLHRLPFPNSKSHSFEHVWHCFHPARHLVVGVGRVWRTIPANTTMFSQAYGKL